MRWLILLLVVACGTPDEPLADRGGRKRCSDAEPCPTVVHFDAEPCPAPADGGASICPDQDIRGWYNGEHRLQAYMPLLPLEGSINPAPIRVEFAEARAAGEMLIFRPRYNSDSSGVDADLATILQHIDELAPILHDYSDVLYVAQLGFIGAWGEWHSSQTFGGVPSPEVRATVIAAALTSWPGYISVRRPIWHQENADPRLTVHDDCLGCSASDGGTWPSVQEDYWRDYISQLTRVTGELSVFDGSPAFADTLEIARATRPWALNIEWNPAVTGHWSPDEMAQFTMEMVEGWR